MTKVVDYSLEALTGLFADYCDDGGQQGEGAPVNHHVTGKHHIGYLDGYMRDLGCATVVVEDQYIDRDFLEDFAAYHVRSFYPYRRNCARLHFFGARFTAEAFLTLIAGDATDSANTLSEAEMQATYLGFVVIKPLPSTVLGRTCLQAYGDKGADKRLYPVSCKESVNLYGIALSVQTLPFQEQDRDVAACASSALWSVFHATGRRFQHSIPSPVQITAAATQRAGYDDRVLPNGNGLTTRQMAEAIRSVGLEPFTVGLAVSPKATKTENLPSNRTLKLKIATAAYLRAGIPCLLLARMHDKLGAETKVRGNHAVALTGYRVGTTDPEPYGETEILFAAARTSKLYAHDDQVGPFARMEFEDDGFIRTSQVNDKRKRFMILAEPLTLMVPLYHKIRIPFNQILEIAISVDAQINVVRKAFQSPLLLKNRIVWDLTLRTLDDYRLELRASGLSREAKEKALTAFLPRFIWQLSAESKDGTALFDLLFDPTDLLQGRLFLGAVVHDQEAFDFVAKAMLWVEPEDWPELPLATLHAYFKATAPESEPVR